MILPRTPVSVMKHLTLRGRLCLLAILSFATTKARAQAPPWEKVTRGTPAAHESNTPTTHSVRSPTYRVTLSDCQKEVALANSGSL